MILQTKPQPHLEAIITEEPLIYDLVIIGGGPAGLAAAIYALRSRLRTLLVEKMILGGLASTTFQIENYPGFPENISGSDLVQRMTEQVKKLGLEVMWGNASQIISQHKLFEVTVEGKKITARSLIIATGTEAEKLGVAGEEEFRGRGVSYCATCDGPFYQNKNVIVVGGGNSAVEEAIYLTRFASKVSIVHRRDQLRADKILAEQAKTHPKIYFFWHSTVDEILGEKSVKEIVLKDLSSNKKLRIMADGVFIYVGSKPNTEAFKGMINLNEKGFVITDENMKTSAPGIFAAGDVRVKTLRQIVTAAADGAIAAEAARIYLENSLKTGR
jgi:thioredoxin reductase (NADPH)